MAHKSHEQFNEAVFRRLCDEAISDLPVEARDEEAVLEHLLAKVRSFCGVDQVTFRDDAGVTRSAQLKQQIIDVVEYDSLIEHPLSLSFSKAPIIDEYVRMATASA